MFSININNYNQNKVVSKDYDDSYKILNYDKSVICDNDTKLGAYRSVIIDRVDNKVLCVAPPKSVTFEYFKNVATNTNITEIIEGTMINLFYDERRASWEIASKSAVGGNYWYFRTEYPNLTGGKQLTFRDMFIDALGAEPGSNLNDIAILNELPKSKIYSFVLQHPNNHIVLRIIRPQLYLVAVYEQMPIDAEGDIKIHIIPLSEVRNYNFNKCVNNVILFPREIDFMECVNNVMLQNNKIDYNVEFNNDILNVGYMFSDSDSGLRTAVLNPRYAEIKELRGNHPNLQYQYFALFQAGKLNEFLWYFPNYHNLFYKFHLQSMDFIKTIHDAYVSYHIQKRGKQVRIDKAIFHHIYKLHHEKYIPSIQNGGEPLIITRKIVADYFNAMEPKEKLYHVNYKLRQEPENNQ